MSQFEKKTRNNYIPWQCRFNFTKKTLEDDVLITYYMGHWENMKILLYLEVLRERFRPNLDQRLFSILYLSQATEDNEVSLCFFVCSDFTKIFPYFTIL